MRVHHEDGYTIISDVYEPAPLPPKPWRPHLFIILSILATAIGALIALNN